VTFGELTIDHFVALVRQRSSFVLPEQVRPYDSLNELGIESIDVFELILITESMALCSVPPAEVPLIFTLADAFDYYWRCRALASDT